MAQSRHSSASHPCCWPELQGFCCLVPQRWSCSTWQRNSCPANQSSAGQLLTDSADQHSDYVLQIFTYAAPLTWSCSSTPVVQYHKGTTSPGSPSANQLLYPQPWSSLHLLLVPCKQSCPHLHYLFFVSCFTHNQIKFTSPRIYALCHSLRRFSFKQLSCRQCFLFNSVQNYASS